MSATRGAAAPASPAREITSTSRQRFVALKGRLSWMRTRSPAFAFPASSCVAKRFRTRITFLYSGCSRCRPTSTMIVFAILAETTTPTLVLRRRRRQVHCSTAPGVTAAGAVRFRATVRFATGRAATAAFAGAFTARVAAGAAFVAVFARGEAFAVSFGGRGAEPPDFFSAIGFTLTRALAHHREEARDLPARLRQGAEVLELPGVELELRVEELFARAPQLVRDLVVRQPPPVLH